VKPAAAPDKLECDCGESLNRTSLHHHFVKYHDGIQLANPW
jgi:hypothetical protein